MNTVLKVAFCFYLFISISPVEASAQTRAGGNSLTGSVTDASTGSALPAVSVFLKGTTRGTSTGNEGKYSLTDVPDGEYDLVVSLIGYEREIRHISLNDSVKASVSVRLTPKQITLSGVDITASAQEWKKLLPAFTREFLGKTANAKKCRILNSEVIALTVGSSGDSLRARTDTTLVVENRALGYKVYIQIEDFLFVARTGWFELKCYPRYLELTPEDESQAEEWKKRREECYEYSFSHFLNGASHGIVRKSQFLISVGSLRDLQRGRGDELDEKSIMVAEMPHTAAYRIDFKNNLLRVDRLDQYGSWKSPLQMAAPLRNYDAKESGFAFPDGAKLKWDVEADNGQSDEGGEIASSIVSLLSAPLQVDRNGNLVKPYSVSFRGFWATRRLADTLPFDYQPEKEKE